MNAYGKRTRVPDPLQIDDLSAKRVCVGSDPLTSEYCLPALRGLPAQVIHATATSETVWADNIAEIPDPLILENIRATHVLSTGTSGPLGTGYDFPTERSALTNQVLTSSTLNSEASWATVSDIIPDPFVRSGLRGTVSLSSGTGANDFTFPNIRGTPNQILAQGPSGQVLWTSQGPSVSNTVTQVSLIDVNSPAEILALVEASPATDPGYNASFKSTVVPASMIDRWTNGLGGSLYGMTYVVTPDEFGTSPNYGLFTLTGNNNNVGSTVGCIRFEFPVPPIDASRVVLQLDCCPGSWLLDQDVDVFCFTTSSLVVPGDVPNIGNGFTNDYELSDGGTFIKGPENVYRQQFRRWASAEEPTDAIQSMYTELNPNLVAQMTPGRRCYAVFQFDWLNPPVRVGSNRPLPSNAPVITRIRVYYERIVSGTGTIIPQALLDHELILNVGTNSHDELDAFKLDIESKVNQSVTDSSSPFFLNPACDTMTVGNNVFPFAAGSVNQVLTRNAPGPTLVWSDVNHANLTNIGLTSHAQLDTFKAFIEPLVNQDVSTIGEPFFPRVDVDNAFLGGTSYPSVPGAAGAVLTITVPGTSAWTVPDRRSYGQVAWFNNPNATAAPIGQFLKVTTNATLFTLGQDFDMPVNGRLRYFGTGSKTFLVTASWTYRLNTTLPKQLKQFNLGRNGVQVSGSTQVVTIDDVNGDAPQSASTCVIVQLSSNQYVELFVTSLDTSDSLVVPDCQLCAIQCI